MGERDGGVVRGRRGRGLGREGAGGARKGSAKAEGDHLKYFAAVISLSLIKSGI
jgi:hypothetical protein